MKEPEWTWERDAAKGKPPPDGLQLSDLSAFHAMANIYRRYKAQELSKEDAKIEKEKIRRLYMKMKQEEENLAKVSKHYADKAVKTERARAEYRLAKKDGNKEEMLKAAERLIEAFDGVSA